jgi:3-methylcrotonyl-CoA carboxylase alpha subunit
LSRQCDLSWRGDRVVASISITPEEARVAVGDRTFAADRSTGIWSLDEAPKHEVLAEPSQVTVFAGPLGTFSFDCPDPLDREAAVGGQGAAISPMPGLVRAVLVSEGQEVAEGDRLVVIEAMKMEHTLSATRDGRVAEVVVAEGQQVEAGAMLVRLDGRGD